MTTKVYYYLKRAMLLSLLCAILSNQRTFGQTVVINTGTAGTPAYNAGPIYRSSASSAYDASRYSYLYTQAELAAAGIFTGSIITELGWTKNNTVSSNGGAIFRIYTKNSTGSDYTQASASWASLNAGTTLVYENLNQSVPATAFPNYITYTLSTPFIYTGGDIEIQTEWDCSQITGNPSTGSYDWMWSTVTDKIYGTGQTSLTGAGTLSSTTNSISTIDDRRPFIQITFTPGTACVNPPTTGTTTVSPSSTVCVNTPITLNLNGNSTGSGLTYEWEESATGTGSWTSISAALFSPLFITSSTTTKWYRCKLICSGGTPVYSTPIQVTVLAPLNGVYTINSANPTGGTNFASFTAAIDALNCSGISGPVTFNVSPGTPYVETLNLGSINGASPTNTVRINGNGAIVQFNNTTSERQLLTLDGTKYMRIDSLVFKSLNATFGWGARITGGAAYDSITRCQFDMSSVTSTTAGNINGIIFSSSTTSATGAGVNGTNVYIANNYIKGSGAAGGLNYGIGIASGGSDSNIISNNLIENFYNNGIYIASAKFTLVEGNEMHKANKTAGIVAGEGIYTATGDMSGSKIIGNRIHSPGGTAGGTTVFRGLSLLGDGTASNPVIVANNVIYRINQGGASSGIYVSTGTYNLIYHNTVSFDQVMTGTAANYGIYTTGANTGTDIVNNLVSITAGTGGIKYGFYHATANGINDAQKNNYYLNSTQPGVQNYGYYTTAYATQAAFQTAYPALELGSPAVDPQFTAPATGNFLPANTVLQNAGNNLVAIVPADINGIPRATLPTIGAYESLPTNINDAAAMTLLSPGGLFCSGPRPVEVVIRNAGANNINTVQVNWSVNGIVQTPFTYSSLLVPSTAPTGQNMDTVLLGNANIIAGANTINVWTSLPNGVTDTDISNDSVNTSLSTTDFTVNALSDTVCANTPVTISLSPASGYVNETITWESSADGLSWTTIAGANAPVLSVTGLTTTTYFRAKVTNAGITCNTTSEEVTVITPAITASIPAERCGPGTLTLSATPSGGDVNWYSAATGGAPLHTGTSFITPNISNTTTYYAAAVTGNSGNIPELMYYRFDVPGTTVPNEASSPVGTNPAPVTGLTIGGTGQFGTGLQGNAGATASNRVNPEWTGTHTGSWTISFWMNVPTPPTTRYMFGNTTGNGTFRCFIGGAANGIRLTGGVPSVTLDMPSWNATGAKVITYVYDQSAGTVSGYINGIFQASVTPGASYPLVGTNFVVGSQGTSIDGTMDEFRMYNRALTAAEVASFWNTPLTGGCESPRIPVVATINEVPTVDLGNDTLICPDAVVTLDATAPVSGLSYSWNTGAATPTINVTAAGTYSVSVANSNCTGYDTIVVGNAPVPAPVLPDSAAICDGNILTLNAGNTGANYLWNDGSSNQTLEVHTGGLYTVDITNSSGCSITDSSLVTLKTIPQVDLGNDTIICFGNLLPLDAQNSGADYLWNTGDQTQSIIVTGEGTYAVTVTNADQCSASDTIEVSTYDAASVNGFHFNPRFDLEPGRVDFVPIDPMFVDSYHWDFGDGNTSNDPNPSNVYANSGSYLVTLTVTNDCGPKDTSLLINVDVFVGVKTTQATDLNIDVFPVPAKDYISIESKDAALTLQGVTVVNTIGQILPVNTERQGQNLKLELSQIAAGNYIIIIETNKGKTYRRFNILK